MKIANIIKETIHTRPVSLYTQMDKQEIEADTRRVQWRKPKHFSAWRQFQTGIAMSEALAAAKHKFA